MMMMVMVMMKWTRTVDGRDRAAQATREREKEICTHFEMVARVSHTQCQYHYVYQIFIYVVVCLSSGWIMLRLNVMLLLLVDVVVFVLWWKLVRLYDVVWTEWMWIYILKSEIWHMNANGKKVHNNSSSSSKNDLEKNENKLQQQHQQSRNISLALYLDMCLLVYLYRLLVCVHGIAR